MKKTCLLSVALVAALVAMAATAFALEPYAIKESAGAPGGATPPCPLAANLNGTCANLTYHNQCSPYIWIFTGIPAGDGFGTRFDGACASAPNTVKRAITYFRGTVPNYSQTVDVYLDRDTNNDGCPDGVIASDLNLDPGERWNCSNFNVCIPTGAGSLIVRSTLDGGTAPLWSTDGPYTSVCDPVGVARSFYYPSAGGPSLDREQPDRP